MAHLCIPSSRFRKRFAAALIFSFMLAMPGIAAAADDNEIGNRFVPNLEGSYDARPRHYHRLDHELTHRANRGDHLRTRVIVRLQPGAVLPDALAQYAHSGRLDILNAHIVVVPNDRLQELAALPEVLSISYDRPTMSANYRTALTVGTRAIQRVLGYSGAGVGVAVIDSGIAFHDDLTPGSSASTFPYGNQRVAAFVDFVNGQLTPY